MSQLVTTVKRHRREIDFSRNPCKINGMPIAEKNMASEKAPFEEEGRRLRLLRQAEGFRTAYAFAKHVDWLHTTLSQFETGLRRVPIDKALQLLDQVPGFSLEWLWTGEKRGLAYDLRKRIEAEEAREAPQLELLAGSKR